MFLRLTVLTDPFAGLELDVQSGAETRVGRLSGSNDLAVPDEFLGPVHFAVSALPGACTLTDLSGKLRAHPRCAAGCFLADLRGASCPASLCRVHDMSGENGVYVNRTKVTTTALVNGDVIVAGTSAFRVEVSEAPLPPSPPLDAPPPPEPSLLLTPGEQDRALAFLDEWSARLTKEGTPLFAIVDAARDPLALPLLRSHDALSYSLYDGPEGEQLADIAPHLVELPPGSPLTQALVRQHWGQAWFTLIFCQFDFKTLRRHLRRFLMVENEDCKQMYFRFYDPRVLRVFLPTCTKEESAALLGPVSYFIAESDRHGEAWAFSHQEGALRTESFRF